MLAYGHPTLAQLILLLAAILLVAGGGVVALLRARRAADASAVAPSPARFAFVFGWLLSIVVLAWHSATRGTWAPVGDNFDALLCLGVMLGAFELYSRRFHPVAGLEFFLTPLVVGLMVTAGIFGRLRYSEYHPLVDDAWTWVHRVSAYAGAVAFAVGAAAGAMYLLAARRLRRKTLGGPSLGSLERIERLTMGSVMLGFSLLTVALITGAVRMFAPRAANSSAGMSSKVLLAIVAWGVYAVVLHAPINPRFRGRRAAILSVVGFVLIVAAMVTVQFTAGGGS